MALIKRKFIWDLLFLGLFIFSVACFALSIINHFSPPKFSDKVPETIKDDEFDPSLKRLNSMVKLEDYCDSFYTANASTRTFPGVVSEIVRKKFYHGYSYYDAHTNTTAKLLSFAVGTGANAIVMADDIVKYPFAACSQQSIVCMGIFKRKGYNVRKVTMFDSTSNQGHFTFEVFYDGSWHFFDTNMEPDPDVLKKYNRPSLSFLKEHPDVIALAYRKKNPTLMQRLVETGKIGPVNKNPAPVASLIQSSTRFFNNFGWIVIGLIMLVRLFVLNSRKNDKILAWWKKKQSGFHHVGGPVQKQEARA